MERGTRLSNVVLAHVKRFAVATENQTFSTRGQCLI